MDNLKLIEEIKELIHESPMCSVDIKPLIEKYTEGLDREQQRPVRGDIFKVLRALKEDKDIDYADSAASMALMTTMQGAYPTNSLHIKSTLKYEKERQVPKTPQAPQYITNITTHGANSPAVANSDRTTIGTDNSDLTKKGLKISRETLNWTIAGIALATLISILVALHVIG
ncbi:hypothetical protein GWC95_02210 [Sediminibacterium roseum]|uniref:Uncharacterized protein n=1 Tax=Sediminibacterium roseum TaxID=1978412 RepID=A0ABW9ZNQ2_9BACT|nr:hypothetical protein [Sediminibacterium roseum]NCI48721.1 hypothetical protein [Sediminibacterium roseum]